MTTDGTEAIKLAAQAGLVLDPWQQFVLQHGLGRREDGLFSAYEVCQVIARQNGKNVVEAVRELAGLFILEERLIVHSAHQFDTSLEAFRLLLDLIEAVPDLDQQVKRVSRSHGEEGIELKGNRRIRFRTRTKGGGRGFSIDCLIFDEAMILPLTAHGALLPTTSARPNPQVWYAGSAVDQDVHEHGTVLARLRERALKGDDPRLAYFEWSLAQDLSEIDDQIAEDPASWAEANPGLGIRISEEYIADEQRSMAPRTFAVERLSVGDWPSTSDEQSRISIPAWRACTDLNSKPLDPVAFVFDVTPQRTAAAIAVAGKREDGLFHLEIVDHRPGTGWVPARLAELAGSHRNSGVRCDTASPAAALLGPITNLGVNVIPVNANEYAQSCGLMADCVEQQLVRHLGTSELEQAIRGAGVRSLSDAWAWSRKSSTVDISPLVAGSIALWAVQQHSPAPFFAFA